MKVVDTKSDVNVASGNDVDTKSVVDDVFGNDGTLGFIRVRKRKLKGGHGTYRRRATASMSFDLVRAVRINGKPRHQFVLGLGSQKENADHFTVFWATIIYRMKRHGLTAPQRLRVATEMVRKGARLPSLQQIEDYGDWALLAEAIPELNNIIEAAT